MSWGKLEACGGPEAPFIEAPGTRSFPWCSCTEHEFQGKPETLANKKEFSSEQHCPTSTGPFLPTRTLLLQHWECFRQMTLTCLCLVLHAAFSWSPHYVLSISTSSRDWNLPSVLTVISHHTTFSLTFVLVSLLLSEFSFISFSFRVAVPICKCWYKLLSIPLQFW